jgi:hypothetical protein
LRKHEAIVIVAIEPFRRGFHPGGHDVSNCWVGWASQLKSLVARSSIINISGKHVGLYLGREQHDAGPAGLVDVIRGIGIKLECCAGISLHSRSQRWRFLDHERDHPLRRLTMRPERDHSSGRLADSAGIDVIYTHFPLGML